MRFVRVALVSGVLVALLAAAALLRPSLFLQAQGPAPYLVLSKEGRQPLAVTNVNGREMVSLDDLSRLFGVTAREDQVARGLVLTVQGRTITFIMPASSSSSRKMKPLAVCGRWRATTNPATSIRVPAATRAM